MCGSRAWKASDDKRCLDRLLPDLRMVLDKLPGEEAIGRLVDHAAKSRELGKPGVSVPGDELGQKREALAEVLGSEILEARALHGRRQHTIDRKIELRLLS